MIPLAQLALPSLAVCLVLSRTLAAATSVVGETQLDEVVVHGLQLQLDEMRNEILQLEDRFYERYNELNRIDDFNVHCVREARIGTRIKKRSCRAVYQDRAFQEEGFEASICVSNIKMPRDWAANVQLQLVERLPLQLWP